MTSSLFEHGGKQHNTKLGQNKYSESLKEAKVVEISGNVLGHGYEHFHPMCKHWQIGRPLNKHIFLNDSRKD